MQYAMLIYVNDDTETSDSISAEYMTLSDEAVGGAHLQPIDAATTVRVADGETLLSDGPFVDAKEYLGGFYLVEADNLDAATAFAARIPAARNGGAVEIRPLVER